MPIEVSPIVESDIPGAVECIQKAFKGDPYNEWVFAENFSLKRNSVSLGIRCRWGMHHALFTVAKDTSDPSGKVLGVACWMPPHDAGEPQSWHDWLGEWWLWFEQVKMNMWYGRGGLNVKRYYIWKKAQAEAQKHIWGDEPRGFYFCNIVTILPEWQGQGIGRKLFESVTKVADHEGRKCYLESSRSEPNMAIYESLGFTLTKEMICDDDGDAITLYCMTREPRLE